MLEIEFTGGRAGSQELSTVIAASKARIAEHRFVPTRRRAVPTADGSPPAPVHEIYRLAIDAESSDASRMAVRSILNGIDGLRERLRSGDEIRVEADDETRFGL